MMKFLTSSAIGMASCNSRMTPLFLTDTSEATSRNLVARVRVEAPNVTVEPAVINIQNVEQRKRVVRKVVRDENNRIAEIIEQTIEDGE